MMTDHTRHQWVSAEDYIIRITDIKEEIVLDGGLQRKKEVRSVRILVSYQNRKNLFLKRASSQWLLYDTDGYNYNSQMSRHFYGEDAPQRLQEGLISFGKQINGWVAFRVPKDAVLDYVQFRTHYISKNTVNISLEKPSLSFAEASKTDENSILQKMWQTVKPKPTTSLFSNLQPNTVLSLKKPVIDFYGNSLVPGEHLTYSKCYPPYHGLHTLLFVEATLYLHEDQHADIFADWDRFFEQL